MRALIGLISSVLLRTDNTNRDLSISRVAKHFHETLDREIKEKKKRKKDCTNAECVFFLNERQMFDVETKIVRMEQRTSCEGVSRVR